MWVCERGCFFLPRLVTSFHHFAVFFPHRWHTYTYLTLATWKWYCDGKVECADTKKWHGKQMEVVIVRAEKMSNLWKTCTRMTTEPAHKNVGGIFSVSRSRRLIDMMKTIANESQKGRINIMNHDVWLCFRIGFFVLRKMRENKLIECVGKVQTYFGESDNDKYKFWKNWKLVANNNYGKCCMCWLARSLCMCN